jgi:hypothetical protein
MYTLVKSNATDCSPLITDLSSEFVSNNVLVISSVANVSAVRVVCDSNVSMSVNIPVDV